MVNLSMNTPETSDTKVVDIVEEARVAVALANRVLSRQGVVDAFGHVSVRHPVNTKNFLLARNMAPAQVVADDVLEFDEDSEPIDAGGSRVYLERFIHGEIYRARPDVLAVVHSHSPAVIPFGVVSSAPLRPVGHMSGFLGVGAPTFEIRCCAGDSSDLLIRSKELGSCLAGVLASNAVVLMRGHGSTVVGNSIYQAVFRAIYTESNARLQTAALQLGTPTYLTSGESAAAAATNDGQIKRAWEMWVEGL